MAKEYKLSSARLKEYENELNYLKTVREKEVAEHLKEARSFGDLSENSEYDEAKNEQAQLYGRIAYVEDILSHAVIVDAAPESAGHISLGCHITVRYTDEGEEIEEEFKLVGSQEANPMEGLISDDSPFGRAVVGHTAGDSVEVDAPDGVLHYTIVSVEKKD